MGFFKEEKPLKRLAFLLVPRWMRTLFFLITMLLSLLLFSAPILLIIADVLLPAALFSASLPLPPPSATLQTLLAHLNSYDFRLSLIDIPLVSIARSAVILCVYSFCDGPRLSRWPYLGVATVCSVASMVFVSLKGSYMLMTGGCKALELGLFISSLGLAIGHVTVAHRTSCRERRKLLVYKIDIEAVSACKNGFPRYHQKILQQANNRYPAI
ncbi:Alpha/beta hydrolase related protein [Dorcoceras hygrometricum]|uniref:Alpha/beta hydrolase related protein n=1 Tax=Dorcoceras hygrometricum TaxID=472368 RepID=A0A2Z7BS48_9LAMI|nr:Alpha/beta hydrolase related protein [Dorcoceras hygrometricum]